MGLLCSESWGFEIEDEEEVEEVVVVSEHVGSSVGCGVVVIVMRARIENV